MTQCLFICFSLMVQKGRIQEDLSWLGVKSLWLCLFTLCLQPPGRGDSGAAGTCPGRLRWCSKPAFLPIPPLRSASCHVHQIIVKSVVLQLRDQKHGARGRQETPQLSACFPPLTAQEQYGVCFEALVMVGGRWTRWHGFLCLKLRDKEKDKH